MTLRWPFFFVARCARPCVMDDTWIGREEEKVVKLELLCTSAVVAIRACLMSPWQRLSPAACCARRNGSARLPWLHEIDACAFTPISLPRSRSQDTGLKTILDNNVRIVTCALPSIFDRIHKNVIVRQGSRRWAPIDREFLYLCVVMHMLLSTKRTMRCGLHAAASTQTDRDRDYGWDLG